MSGPEKAALIITLAVVGLIAFNIVLWRRMKSALAAAKAEQERQGEA